MPDQTNLDFPPLIGAYEKFVGFATSDAFTGALVGSHSHEMAVAAMALIIMLLAQQFGYGTRTGISRALATVGMVMVALGTVVVTAMYVTAGFTTWSPPAWFVSGPGGANGIASDDIISGILVMGGGLLVAAALVGQLPTPVALSDSLVVANGANASRKRIRSSCS